MRTNDHSAQGWGELVVRRPKGITDREYLVSMVTAYLKEKGRYPVRAQVFEAVYEHYSQIPMYLIKGNPSKVNRNPGR